MNAFLKVFQQRYAKLTKVKNYLRSTVTCHVVRVPVVWHVRCQRKKGTVVLGDRYRLFILGRAKQIIVNTIATRRSLDVTYSVYTDIIIHTVGRASSPSDTHQLLQTSVIRRREPASKIGNSATAVRIVPSTDGIVLRQFRYVDVFGSTWRWTL